MSLEIGDRIDGKYEIVRLLGEGGMGAVYEGLNTRIHRRVAIKVLHASVASNDEAMKRFEREAQAAGRIGSEHIVEVLDLGDLPGGERYMVMEFLEGEPLSARIARGRMAPREIAPLIANMLAGIEAAHRAGIIHRDLKPDNVFLLSRGDFVKIVDFGISKFNAMGSEFSMTRTGAVMGTPYYMAPEQAKGGKDVDHRVDVYAAGVILYQAVVGAVPFDAGTFNELLFKIVLETPPSISKVIPDIDPAFVAIVERAMARDLSERYASAAELQAALTNWLGGTFIPAGRTVSAGTPLMPLVTSTSQSIEAGGATMFEPSAGGTLLDGASDLSPVTAPLTRKSSLPYALVALAVALAGAAFMFMGAQETNVAEELSPAPAAADDNAAARATALSQLEEERKKAADARKAAEAAEDEAARNQAALEEQTSKRNAAEAEAATSQKPAPGAVAKPSPRPARTQAPAAAKPPAPAVTPPSPTEAPTSSGRPIRRDL